jgi:hypothetical protein
MCAYHLSLSSVISFRRLLILLASHNHPLLLEISFLLFKIYFDGLVSLPSLSTIQTRCGGHHSIKSDLYFLPSFTFKRSVHSPSHLVESYHFLFSICIWTSGEA